MVLFKKLFGKPNIKLVLSILAVVGVILGGIWGMYYFYQQAQNLNKNLSSTAVKNKQLLSDLQKTQKALEDLKNQDQYKRNEELQKEVASINKTYKKTVTLYEELLKLKTDVKKTEELEKLLALTLTQLADKNYASGEATLAKLEKGINDEKAKLAAAGSSGTVDIASVRQNNSAPGSGFSRQRVSTSIGDFVVNIVAADLGSTRVIVDTASDSTCANDCPVLSLGDYVARNGAYAGINGSYFCPASYPSCAGKTNSFDTLLMNKNKVYFNSDNNVYSNVPVVAFYGTTARFMGASSEWGRDTGVDAVIANQPLLLSGGNIVFGGDGDPKKGGRGNRSFVASKGSTVYIGVVQNATVAEVAHALKAMGIENALNLDSGGSTALWSGGYKFGPGRNIPNAILFVRK